MVRKKFFRNVGVAALLVSFHLAGTTAFAQLSGAIFTSTASGTTVNGNIYQDKEDVYLNGGPQPNAPCTAAGLPDGDYYFQVTNPSGSLLLSTDSVADRQVRVVGGVIAQNLGTHSTGGGTCPGSISVQLMPYLDTPNPGGEYKVWITPVDRYSPGNGFWGFLPQWSKTDNYKVRRHVTNGVGIFGHKFYDTNVNGQWDSGEPAIPGWRIEKVPPTPSDVTYTASNGQYSFLVASSSGTYTISEVAPPPGFVPTPGAIWIATTPTSGQVTVGTSDVAGPDFGNVCLGPGNGRTLGFWSNRNGQRLFGADDLAAMVALNLRNANGSHFNPASYTQFRSWLLNATATNMAYMLSAQLAAMQLNVLNGFVSGSALIYAPGTSSADSNGFATVSAILAEANTELGLHGLVLSNSAFRAYQEALKNALDQANNNQNFVQSGPCAFTSPY